MADPIELSIEETNKLRAQIGLPLIPTEIPGPKKQDSDGLSIAETNKLRLSLGLTPLVESKPAPNNNETSSGERDEEQIKSNNFDTKSEIEKPRKHVVTFHYDDVDAESWLDSVGNDAPSVEKEQTKPIKSHDLGSDDQNSAPTTVRHGASKLASLADGEIFTLADSGILEDAGDELVNETLAKEAKLEKDKKEREKEGFLKFGRPRSEEEVMDNGNDSETESTFLQEGTISLKQNTENTKNEISKHSTDHSGGHTTLVQGLFDDLDSAEENGPTKKVSMKKLKSKKSKGTSKKRKRDDDISESFEPMYTTALEVEDDMEDDLGEIFNKARNKQNKTRKVMTAEEIANEVRSHMRADMAAEADSGWVFDDTKEFLDNLRTVSKEVEEESTAQEIPNRSDPESNAEEPKIKESTKISEEHSQPQKPDPVEITSHLHVDSATEPLSKTSTSPNLSSISATLKYLRDNQEVSSTQGSKVSKLERERRRNAELARIQIGIEERLVRQQMAEDAAFSKLKAEEQEKIIDKLLNERLVHKGIISEPKESGKYARYSESDPLKDYSPQVNVEYKDARGNKLDKKQAWKELSHRYHGSAPKQKKDPVVKKSTEEKVIR